MSDESAEFSDIDEFFTQMSSKGGSSPSRSPAQSNPQPVRNFKMSSKETVGSKKNQTDFTSKYTASTAQRRYKNEEDQDLLRAQSLKKLHQGAISPQPLPHQHESQRLSTFQGDQSPYAGRLQPLDESMSQKSALTNLAERAFMQGAKPNSVFELILRANDKISKSPSLHSGMTLSKRRQTVGSDLRSQTSVSSKAYQTEHAERLVKELDEKARKRKELELIAQTRQMEDCTFRPKIISRKPHDSNKRVSSHEARRFYEEELEFQNRKLQKIESVRRNQNQEKERNWVHEKMTDASGKPEICKGSEKIYKRKVQEEGAVDVHERLYKNGKDFFNKHQLNSILQESLDEPDQSIEITTSFAPNFSSFKDESQFQPKINKKSQNLKRKTNVTSLLDQDAKRRQEKFSLLEKQGKSFKGQVEASKKSGNLMFQKFEKRLTEVVLQYDSSKDQSGIIMYEHFGLLMANLGFVYIGQDKVAPEVPKLLHQLWECVCYNPYASEEDEKENKQSGVTSFENLRSILSAILNFYFVWMEVEQPVYLEPRQRMFNEQMPSVATSEATGNTSVNKDTRSQFIERTYGAKFTEDGKVSLNQQGQQQLHQKFKAFYYIYQQNYTSYRNQKAQIAPPQHSFKPAVCRSSEKMDMSRRMIAPLSETGGLETVLEADANLTAGSPVNQGQRGGVSRHDLLLKKGMEYQEKKKQKIAEKKAKELDGINFKPKILNTSNQQRLLKGSSSAGSLKTKNLKEINNILRERAKATITDDQDFIPEEGEGGTGGYSGPVPQYQQKRSIDGKKRIQELAQPKIKRALSPQELEYERNKTECSFKPKIQAKPDTKKEKPKVTRQDSVPDVSHLVTQKDLDGTIDGLNFVVHKKLKNEVLQFEKEQSSRAGGMDTHPDIYDEPLAMTQEYKEASEISQSPARGDHEEGVQNFTLKAGEDQQEDTREVILEMNVKLEDGRAKVLYIREGDTAAEAAAVFSQKMGIPKSLQNKLEVLVQQQMNSLLSKIEEEEELSCIASSKNGTEIHQANI